MESSSVNGLCRCCASQGAFKDIKTSYHWMGDEEVYSDMLRECFDVNLTSADQGGICELCITQLRNASNFKKQVLQTEAQFKQHLRSKGFKPAVKEEMSGFDDNDSDDNDMDNVDDEDYVPDYDVPIKTESESEEKPKKRTAKSVSTRAKKSKSSDGDAAVKNRKNSKEASSEPPKNPTPPEPELTKPKPVDQTATRDKLLRDMKQILMFSNATPIWKHGFEGYQCVYCEDYFKKPSKLKKHTQGDHDNVNEARFFVLDLTEYILKLDITGLKCGCCKEDIDTLEDLINHLNFKHKKKIDENIKDIILPFKFDTNDLRCVVCSKDFINFDLLQEHMITHCDKKYVCEMCGSAFMWDSALQAHFKDHKDPAFKCNFCSKKFTTTQRRDQHTPECTGEKIICDYCPQSFGYAFKKTLHMSREHGSGANSLCCNSCNKYFPDASRLGLHIRRTHMMEKNFVCQECGMGFFSKGNLRRHSMTHTGKKDFRCDYCLKYLQTRSNLIVHMRIHTNEKPFQCQECDAAFTQKAGLQRHTKMTHGVIM